MDEEMKDVLDMGKGDLDQDAPLTPEELVDALVKEQTHE